MRLSIVSGRKDRFGYCWAMVLRAQPGRGEDERRVAADAEALYERFDRLESVISSSSGHHDGRDDGHRDGRGDGDGHGDSAGRPVT
ncbi:hypothetical protein GCM10022420_013510 [Streptomyces iranensis]